MKTKNLVWLGLAALGIYLITRKPSTSTDIPIVLPEPDPEVIIPEQTKPPMYNTRPPKQYRQEPGLPPGVTVQPGTEGPATMQGISGYFSSGMTGGVIEFPFGARWFNQEPTTTKNAKMVL